MGSNATKKANRLRSGHRVIIKEGVLSARTICGLATPAVNDERATECQSCAFNIKHHVRVQWVKP